jgi:hypothetical protein
MTVKITPNGRGNPMTVIEHERSSDQEIARAATPTRITESSASEDPAFERHDRIGELAEMWQLGRETVRLLVKDERGVIKIRLGRKEVHTIYSVPESVAVRIHTRLLNSANGGRGAVVCDRRKFPPASASLCRLS